MSVIKDVKSHGQGPKSKALKLMLANALSKRCEDDQIIVHHFTDLKNNLQLEVERRSKTLGLKFERIIL